jgi:hypothetical protein
LIGIKEPLHIHMRPRDGRVHDCKLTLGLPPLIFGPD